MSTPPVAATALTLIALAALLVAEARQARGAKLIAKPLASIGFVAVAVTRGATDAASTTALLVAGLSLVGDLLLLSRARPYFLAGLFAFLAGHLAYVVAFASRGLAGAGAIVAAPLLVAGLAAVIRWLLPHVRGSMRGPVIAYMLVISLMALAAAATCAHRATWTIPVGAAMFYLSDVSVALDRFVAPGFVHRAWGLPLYYGGQLLLAWSAVSA